MQRPYQLLADAVLTLHALFVAFIVFGLLFILIGGIRNSTWINNSWFRVLHLAGIGIVVFQSWLGVLCPLTTLEMWLRRQADSASYTESFIQHWLQQVLFYQAPMWVFAVTYTVFGLLVIFAWFKYPPGFNRKAR